MQHNEMLKAIKARHTKEVNALRRAMKDPDPLIDFGEAGEEYSFDVYRFCAKLLNCKLTCTAASRVIEVVFEEFFPKRVIRVPPREAMERFRRIMLLAGRYKSLKVLSMCDHWHCGGDATTKVSVVGMCLSPTPLTQLTDLT